MSHPSVLTVMQELVAEGGEQGLQVAAYFRGELILDLAVGTANFATGRAPVATDTLFPVYSVTKGVAATITHILAERGVVSYDRPIADVWPEFGCHGKESITLRQALSHSCGLTHMPAALKVEDLKDWDFMCARIAELTPVWPPGSRVQYHPVTFGWIVGETLRRADGRGFQQLLHEEICAPLEITDLHVGIPEGVEDRIALVWEDRAIIPEPVRAEPNVSASIPFWLFPLDELMNRPEARRSCLPATSGIMTARAIARHYAATLPGGIDGVELFPASRLRLATEPQFPSPVPPDFTPSTSLGYQTGSDLYTGKSFGHGGHGGSAGFADPEIGLAVGIAKNTLNNKIAAQRIAAAIRQAVA